MEYYKVQSKVRIQTDEDLTKLPKGFRFHPTDKEIVIHYLIPKALNSNFRAAPISQADFNKCEPWDLPKKPNMSDTERYYYCQRDRKYPSGVRTNRATKAGYWKATGKDKEIFKGVGIGRELIGMKKTLVFYTGRAPNGDKTNWVMHEFRLQQNSNYSSIPKDDGWVVSRVFHKISTTTVAGNSGPSPMEGSDTFCTDDLIVDNIDSSLPELVDTSAVIALYSSNVSSVNIASVCYPEQSDDELLIYSSDPDYYHPGSLSETLFETVDSFGYDNVNENKCKVEQQCPSSSAISVPMKDTSYMNVEVSEYDLLKLWD